MTEKFNTVAFEEYMHDNFSFSSDARMIIGNLVDYGVDHCNSSKDQFVNFISDIVDDFEPEEIAMFCPEDWLSNDMIILANDYMLKKHIIVL